MVTHPASRPDNQWCQTASKLKAFLTDQNTASEPEYERRPWHSKQNDPAFSLARIYAYINTYNELVLLDFAPFEKLFEGTSSKYISIRENMLRRHGKSIEQVKVFCQQGRIRGAMKINSRAWGVPEDAPYPEDSRLTANGKYVGRRNKSR